MVAAGNANRRRQTPLTIGYHTGLWPDRGVGKHHASLLANLCPFTHRRGCLTANRTWDVHKLIHQLRPTRGVGKHHASTPADLRCPQTHRHGCLVANGPVLSKNSLVRPLVLASIRALVNCRRYLWASSSGGSVSSKTHFWTRTALIKKVQPLSKLDLNVSKLYGRRQN